MSTTHERQVLFTLDDERARLAILTDYDVTYERGPAGGPLHEVSRGHFASLADALDYADARCLGLLRAGWQPSDDAPPRVFCAYCHREKVAGAPLGPRPTVRLRPLPGEAISHGLCAVCEARMDANGEVPPEGEVAP
jgi:hypothetical protein